MLKFSDYDYRKYRIMGGIWQGVKSMVKMVIIVQILFSCLFGLGEKKFVLWFY